MANAEHLVLLQKGVPAWNLWHTNEYKYVDLHQAALPQADLRGAKLCGADLRHADLSGANLSKVDLRQADLREAALYGARLSWANLTGADLHEVSLREAALNKANLRKADVSDADLHAANLSKADFTGADLSGANLRKAILIGTNLTQATLSRVRIYGVSVWDVNLQDAIQTNLVITPADQPEITVDNLEVAQFIYLLLNNARIRDVIDTITSKAVLILGRFTPERKTTLEALRNALRSRNYLPIVFDFEKPTNRDFTETVSTLAHLARFVIADLTDPRCIPQELTAVIPRLLSVPVRPLLLGSQKEWAMFCDLARYPQVIEPLHYTDDAMLLGHLEADIIEPAEQRACELAGR